MDINAATGKAISAERAIAGMTVRELSQKAGIPLSSLMRVLQAEREIKINQIAAIAAALDLYPHDIVEHAERIMERENRTAPIVKLPSAPHLSAVPDNVAAYKNDGTHREFDESQWDN